MNWGTRNAVTIFWQKDPKEIPLKKFDASAGKVYANQIKIKIALA
jgi:hypothetical protein